MKSGHRQDRGGAGPAAERGGALARHAAPLRQHVLTLADSKTLIPCIQVIDKIVAELGLPRSAAVPSRDTLRRFGNTSPASTFYILAHLESHVRADP